MLGGLPFSALNIRDKAGSKLEKPEEKKKTRAFCVRTSGVNSAGGIGGMSDKPGMPNKTTEVYA